MPTRLIRLNGAEIYVEVDELDTQFSRSPATGDLADRGLTATGVADRVADAGYELRQMLSAVTSSIQQALEKSRPNEWTVELSVGFKGEAGVPCLTRGQTNATIKLTAKWNSPS
jgi:NTP-dependent ternary system trypsin peptidase co-occuring protein